MKQISTAISSTPLRNSMFCRQQHLRKSYCSPIAFVAEGRSSKLKGKVIPTRHFAMIFHVLSCVIERDSAAKQLRESRSLFLKTLFLKIIFICKCLSYEVEILISNMQSAAATDLRALVHKCAKILFVMLQKNNKGKRQK